MDKKTEAIFKVKLGASLTDVATHYNISTSTLKRWIDAYEPPDKNIIVELLSERLVDVLNSGIKGSDLNGICTALKIIETGGIDIIDKLMQMGDDDATTIYDI